MLPNLWESKVALREGEMGGALHEGLGILALGTSGLDTPLTLQRTTYRVVGSDLAALGTPFGGHRGAPDHAAVAGMISGAVRPGHRFAPAR